MSLTFTELPAPLGLPAAPTQADLAPAGYSEHEYLIAGEATSYRAAERPSDGRIEVEEHERSPFVTRIFVRRPPAGAANGTVLVEWLNVTAGVDAAPEFAYLAEEIL